MSVDVLVKSMGVSIQGNLPDALPSRYGDSVATVKGAVFRAKHLHLNAVNVDVVGVAV